MGMGKARWIWVLWGSDLHGMTTASEGLESRRGLIRFLLELIGSSCTRDIRFSIFQGLPLIIDRF